MEIFAYIVEANVMIYLTDVKCISKMYKCVEIIKIYENYFPQSFKI